MIVEHVVVQSNYLSKEKALNIAAWSGNVSASQILVNGGDKPFSAFVVFIVAEHSLSWC